MSKINLPGLWFYEFPVSLDLIDHKRITNVKIFVDVLKRAASTLSMVHDSKCCLNNLERIEYYD